MSEENENDKGSDSMSLSLSLAQRIKTVWILQDIHYISTLLHPSLKHFHIATEEKSKAIELTKEEILKYQASEASANSSIGNLSCSSIKTATKLKCAPTSPTTHSILVQCFDLLVDDEDAVPSLSKDKELIDYLASKDTLEPEDDVLLFWKKRQPSFPALAGIVKSIYCVPASNTTVERLFSAAGNTITDRRSNLDSERVNKILFLNKNLLQLKAIERHQSTLAPQKRKLTHLLSHSPSPSATPIDDDTDDDEDHQLLSSTPYSSTRTKKHRAADVDFSEDDAIAEAE